METSNSKTNLDTTVEQCSPPRSSDSDWSDINTDEENNITDDEDTGDTLIIDISKKHINDNSQPQATTKIDEDIDYDIQDVEIAVNGNMIPK